MPTVQQLIFTKMFVLSWFPVKSTEESVIYQSEYTLLVHNKWFVLLGECIKTGVNVNSYTAISTQSTIIILLVIINNMYKKGLLITFLYVWISFCTRSSYYSHPFNLC